MIIFANYCKLTFSQVLTSNSEPDGVLLHKYVNIFISLSRNSICVCHLAIDILVLYQTVCKHIYGATNLC